MRARKTLVSIGTAAAASLALVAGSIAGSTAVQADETTAATIVTYDVSAAEEFVEDMHDGAEVWNDNVENVALEPVSEGEEAMVDIVATDGWPLARVDSLGHGTIEFGRQAVDEGHNTTRIASHELGHLLGLPDVKPGPCSSLMSGASAGTDCTNAIPDDEEKAEVESNFGSGYQEKSRDWRDLEFPEP